MTTSKKKLLSTLVVGLIATLSFTLFSFDYPLPEGWIKYADKSPQSFNMGVDKGAGLHGENAATVKSIDKQIDGFGTLMQYFKPGKNWLGKRIRMTGYLKTKDVADWAGLWMRVDYKDGSDLDNMHDGKKGDRSIKGTTDWKQYDILLDVPNSSTNISFGALLSGTGQIWFTNIKFEVVGNSGQNTPVLNQTEPINLDFKK